MMTGLKWLIAHIDYAGDGCLIWPKFRDPNGYGRIGIGRGKWAHRVMCELAHGPAPAGHEVSHSCGNGKLGCVHPRHLSWKTRSQNQLERRKHGTHGKRKGVRYWLTPEQVAEIRSLKGKVTQVSLAKKFNISPQAIGMVMRGETWKKGAVYSMGKPRHRERAAS